jgi:glycosyltransferase involved in cell wall biosynthesis
MKIIGLVPFKNEEWILSTCLSSLKPICDEIICIDDNSTDESKKIALSFGCKVFDNDKLTNVGWSEHHIRKNLLSLGRQMNGTHFICLDADEAITAPFTEISRKVLEKLKPGQKLSMQWLSLWKSLVSYREDHSIWSNLYKDFIVCDDHRVEYEYKWLHVDRTPGPTNNYNTIRLNTEHGAIMHYQFSDWDRYQIKQCDYRCCELIKTPGTEIEINRKYSISLPDDNVKLKVMPIDWYIKYPKPNMKIKDWRWQRLINNFDEYGIEFFKNLDIWHYTPLKIEFIRRTGSDPLNKL